MHFFSVQEMQILMMHTDCISPLSKCNFERKIPESFKNHGTTAWVFTSSNHLFLLKFTFHAAVYFVSFDTSIAQFAIHFWFVALFTNGVKARGRRIWVLLYLSEIKQ